MRFLQWVLIGAVLAGCNSAPIPPLATLPVLQPELQTTAPTSLPLLTLPPIASRTPTLISSPTPTAGWIEKPDSVSPVIPTSASSVFQLLELTFPLSPDGIARVMIQTTPGAQCSLDYRRPDGTLSHAEGLGLQLANSQGIFWWTWKLWIGAKTPLSGIGRLLNTVNGAWQFFDIVLK
jgi:hypothetical protein